jgi:hypothetical protein
MKFKIAIILIILYNKINSQVSLCDKITIEDFTTEKNTTNDLTKSITMAFGDALSSCEYCNVLNWKDTDKVKHRRQNEEGYQKDRSKNDEITNNKEIAIADKILIGTINLNGNESCKINFEIIKLDRTTLKSKNFTVSLEDLSETKINRTIKRYVDSFILKDINKIVVTPKGIDSNLTKLNQRVVALESDKYSKESGEINGELIKKIEPIKMISAGGFIFMSGNKDPKQPFTILGLKANSLKLWIENNEIKVSTLIRNEKGELIGELEANQWMLNKDKRLDRNFDNKSVEILDNEGQVVLQLYYDGEKANFQGVIRDENGSGVLFVIDELVNTSNIIVLAKGEKAPKKIKRMFRYPSDLHKGEKVK